MFSFFGRPTQPSQEESSAESTKTDQVPVSTQHGRPASKPTEAQATLLLRGLGHQSYEELGRLVVKALDEVTSFRVDADKLLTELDVEDIFRKKVADQGTRSFITRYRHILTSDFFKVGDIMLAHGKKYPESTGTNDDQTSNDTTTDQNSESDATRAENGEKPEFLDLCKLLIMIEKHKDNIGLTMTDLATLKRSITNAELLLSAQPNSVMHLPGHESLVSPRSSAHARGILRLLFGDLERMANVWQERSRTLHEQSAIL